MSARPSSPSTLVGQRSSLCRQFAYGAVPPFLLVARFNWRSPSKAAPLPKSTQRRPSKPAVPQRIRLRRCFLAALAGNLSCLPQAVEAEVVEDLPSTTFRRGLPSWKNQCRAMTHADAIYLQGFTLRAGFAKASLSKNPR